MRVRQLLLPALLFLNGTITGQIDLASYTSSNGLPDDNVTCIRQDREGFLWIGTTNGLCRFDGTHFYTFPAGLIESNRISGDLILDLEEDGDHMWIAHRFGLSRINKYSFASENFQTPDSGTKYTIDRAIRDIYRDKQGTIWLSGDRQLMRFDKTTGSIKVAWDLEIKRPLRASSQVSKIISAGEDRILLYLVNGWAGYDTKKNMLDSQLVNVIPVSFMRGENLRLRSYWNTFASNYFVFYNAAEGTLRISSVEIPGAILQVKNIYVDSNLTVYTNSEKNQVAAWTKDNRLTKSGSPGNFPDNYNLKEFNYGCRINGLQCWGSPNGLSIIGRRSGWSKEYFFSAKAAVAFKRQYDIRDVKEYDEDHWLVAANGGLFRMNRTTHELQPFVQWQDSVVYTMLVMPDRTCWLSTDQFLYHFNPVTGKNLRSHFIESYAMALHYFDQQLLVATRGNGIVLLDISGSSVVRLSAGDPVRKITYDRITSVKPVGGSGDFFIAYNQPGQYSRNNFITGAYQPDSIPASASVFKERFVVTAVQPGNKQFWFGQYVGGVTMYDSVSGSWINFTRQTGLTSNYISEIMNDRFGRTWIVTGSGVDIYDPNLKTGYQFPLRLRSGGRTGGFISLGGTLVFFDREKIIETDAASFNLDPGTKKILLSRVLQGNDQLNIRENSVRLPYNKNSLSIIFSLQKLEPGVETRYGYRLRGKDDWTEIGTETELNFASLQPGAYHLQLRATDEFGQWSHYSDVLSLSILPPFWKTWWFFLLIALFVSAVLWMFYRYRINQLRKVLAMRAKISQDLHDEVGATLSGVTLMSELANERLKAQKGAETQSIIERITTESKEMAERMNDIVWAINPVNDSVEKVLNKIHGYGNNLCSSRNIHFHFIQHGDKEEVSLNMQKRNNIYLISKEAINNAVKYSGAQHISFLLSGKKHTYTLTIKDDGKGFDASASYTGNGLVNMRARAAEIGGRLTISSEPGKGTQVELTI